VLAQPLSMSKQTQPQPQVGKLKLAELNQSMSVRQISNTNNYQDFVHKKKELVFDDGI